MSLRQILSVAQMRAAEQALIDNGETVERLMERAGTGAAEYVFRVAAGRPVTVLCGPGNNGGDGYVIARVLAERGLEVSVVAPLNPATDAARAARAKWGGVPVKDANGRVFVDCLFGSGLTRGLSNDLEALLLHLAASHELRVAVDLPSGIESDSGALLNPGLPTYNLTIALGAWKFAHWSMPGMAQVGERRLVDIGAAEVSGAAQLAERATLSAPVMDAHKYTRGLLGVIGGEMPGAARLASRAAQYGGAGYVKLFADDSANAPDDLVVDTGPLEMVLADERLSALLIGPGLGRDDLARERLADGLARNCPTVLDADALMLLNPDLLAGRSAQVILTPHDGELAHLCRKFGLSNGTKRERASALARVTGATIVAKGPDSCVAAPDRPVHLMPPAPSWLSTAGTGDVLAGLIASRLTNCTAPIDAALEGCALHAEAARIAGPALIAGSLIEAIASAYESLL